MNSFIGSDDLSPQKPFGIVEENKASLMNLFVSKDPDSGRKLIKDEILVYTPLKEKDDIFKFQITPVSLVEKLVELSPMLTTLTKNGP